MGPGFPQPRSFLARVARLEGAKLFHPSEPAGIHHTQKDKLSSISARNAFLVTVWMTLINADRLLTTWCARPE
jgi:hypothetical protein